MYPNRTMPVCLKIIGYPYHLALQTARQSNSFSLLLLKKMPGFPPGIFDPIKD